MLVLWKLWSDEQGFVISAELVLITTITVLGLTAALTCLRDAVAGELKDVAGAIGSLNQSYCFSGMHGCVTRRCGLSSWTAGSSFGDQQDEVLAFDCPIVPPMKQSAPKPVPRTAPPVVEEPPLPKVAPKPCPEQPCPPKAQQPCCPTVPACPPLPAPCASGPALPCPPSPCPVQLVAPRPISPCPTGPAPAPCQPGLPPAPLVW